MERTGTVIIAETEYLVAGEGMAALREAGRLAGEGKKVLLASAASCLAEDICGTNRYRSPQIGEELLGEGFTPDSYQLSLEENCEKLGITLLYCVRYVDKQPVNGKTLVRFAAKGGLFGILCGEFADRRESAQDCSYIALVTEKGKPGFGLFEISAEVGENTDQAGADAATATARRLYACRRELIRSFLEKRKENPDLYLGRFARRGFGGKAARRESGEETGIKEARRVFPKGQNRFGRYGFLELPEKKAAVSAGQESCDLVVAGGGTAGVMAAIHAAKGGLRTVLIEPNYDLGGTQTAGGVSTYWFGHRFSDVREMDGLVDGLCTRCGVRKRQGIWSGRDDFHAGIRSFVYLKCCLEAGVKVVFGQIAYDAFYEERTGGRIGVVTAGDVGNRVYFAEAVIDATGDGDLAVALGAAGCYGSKQDLITYWASLAQYTSPDAYRNNFSSMLFAEDPFDYTRFIRLGRKRGEEKFDHGSYVSMRESRHIRGMAEVSLKDLITYRTWEDALYTCYSNYDPKGKLDADMVYCGVLPPQVSIQIPLSALLPVDGKGRRIEGLYVAGKAISATHNVFPSIRMQPDLMHQGAVLGGLLAKALSEGTVPERMDPEKRREFLLACSDDPLTLPENRLTAEECAKRVTVKSRSQWVDVPFEWEETGSFETLGLIAAEPEEVRPVLRRRLEQETEEETREMLIGYALWHGMDDWTQELCSALCRKIRAADGLPERAGSTMCAQLLPDHGVMPELAYQLNQLGWSGKDCVLEPFALVLDRLENGERDYRTIQKGIYHYIEAFAYAAAHNPQKGFIPMLKRLLKLPELERSLTDMDSVDLMTERYQILVFILNRALALLGEEEGRDGLRRLTALSNMAVSGSARMTLERLKTEERTGFPTEGIRKKVW